MIFLFRDLNYQQILNISNDIYTNCPQDSKPPWEKLTDFVYRYNQRNNFYNVQSFIGIVYKIPYIYMYPTTRHIFATKLTNENIVTLERIIALDLLIHVQSLFRLEHLRFIKAPGDLRLEIYIFKEWFFETFPCYIQPDLRSFLMPEVKYAYAKYIKFLIDYLTRPAIISNNILPGSGLWK